MRCRLLRYSLLVGATISAMFLGACGSEGEERAVTVEETVVKTVPAGVETVTTPKGVKTVATPKAVETVTPPQQVTVVETEVVVETVQK